MPAFLIDATGREGPGVSSGPPAHQSGESGGPTPQPGFPAHVGLIMDGNGRWAAARGLPRLAGHRRGLEALRCAVRAAIEFKLAYLTIYSFSAENWKRPLEEVQGLMGLLKGFLRKDLRELHATGIRVRVIGARDTLQHDIRGLLEEAEALTCRNTGLTLVVAFNYGGRQEITAAIRAIGRSLTSGQLKENEIDECLVSQYLDTAGIPDPDLIIRTSGEQRLSNFLPWQAAYSEFIFLPMLWPDFDRSAFAAALSGYAARERRFGGLPRA
jgi:undecaprenyl diphosphate synthase